ncbi:integrase core domain protein [Trichuris suis]|nr:integrase core domain protein [Trichuris suis]
MAASSSETGSLQCIRKDLDIKTSDMYNPCFRSCAYGKQTRKSFSIREERPTVAGGLINADVCGPMSVTSLGGARYFLVFKDDYTKFPRLFLLKRKSEVTGNLKQFLAKAETTGHRVSALRADNGSEFDNRGIQNILAAKGITFLSSMPYTPEQKGCSERENRTLVDCTRSMLESKKLPKFLWAEAVATAAYIYNLTGRTPEEGKITL